MLVLHKYIYIYIFRRRIPVTNSTHSIFTDNSKSNEECPSVCSQDWFNWFENKSVAAEFMKICRFSSWQYIWAFVALYWSSKVQHTDFPVQRYPHNHLTALRCCVLCRWRHVPNISLFVRTEVSSCLKDWMSASNHLKEWYFITLRFERAAVAN